MRGEYDVLDLSQNALIGSPPLARGIQLIPGRRVSAIGITPACAGNTRYISDITTVSRDHPRLRGEYYTTWLYQLERAGSPPLARGIPEYINLTCTLDRITPACAGNTIDCRAYRGTSQDHPRLRGEYKNLILYMTVNEGSPQLARGIPLLTALGAATTGITPACAGNTSYWYYRSWT